jgi:diguanylate cyclase (GGDEF)-like protein
VTVSIGIAHFRERADDLEALIRRADEAMYRAKEHGRNRVELFFRQADNR